MKARHREFYASLEIDEIARSAAGTSTVFASCKDRNTPRLWRAVREVPDQR